MTTTPSDLSVSANESKQLNDEIASLLIPIADQQLLLPTVSVAEMLPYKKPQIRDTQIDILPSWFLGNVLWRGVMVPMFSYEAINGQPIPSIKGVSQMAILNNTGASDQLPFICFPTQGIPRLNRISVDAIKVDENQTLANFDEMHVIINDDAAIIPNIQKIEQAVAALLGLS